MELGVFSLTDIEDDPLPPEPLLYRPCYRELTGRVPPLIEQRR